MPSSTVHTFTDPDEYAAAARGTTAEMAVIGSGPFTAKLVRIDLHCLWMQRFSENLPRVGHSAHMAGRAAITFRTGPGPGSLVGGVEIPPTSILRYSHADEYHYRTSGPTSLAAMSLSVEDMASAAAMAGLDLTPPRDSMPVTPTAAAMARLQRLHAAAGRLAEEAPGIIANPEAARGLEQTLIEAMVDCLGYRPGQHEKSLALGQHQIVMRRFHRVVEENPEQPLYIPEICKAIRVSERTLRACCQEHLGMSPKQYLLLRRMHLARRALRTTAPEAATVTDLATRYGF